MLGRLDTSGDTGRRGAMDHNDEDANEATGPRAYRKKHKASS